MTRWLLGLVLTVLTGAVLASVYGVVRNSPEPPPPSQTDGTQDNDNALDLANWIRVSDPRPQATVTSPLRVIGEARGSWFFEASFPVRLYDANGQLLSSAIAQTASDWMTDSFVPFSVDLPFVGPTTPTGQLVLEKDNPSGLPQNAKQFILPVRFP